MASSDSTADHQNASDSVMSNEVKGGRRVISLIMTWIVLTNVMVTAITVYTYSMKRDGEWSNWGEWSKCNGGLRSRSRYCNSPPPSIFGQYCQGSSDQYQICNLVSCKDGKQSLFGSEHRYSDAFKHATEEKNEILTLLLQVSQRTDLIEINLEKYDKLIKEEQIQKLVLEKIMKGDREERLQQDTIIQNEVDAFKSNMAKMEKHQSKLMHNIKEIERMSINEINSMRHSFDTFKRTTTKRLKEERTLISTEHIKFIKQISTAVEEVKKQTKHTVKEFDDFNRSFKTFKADTSKTVEDYKTLVSDDLSDFMQQISTTVQEVEEQTQMTRKNVTSELVMISDQISDMGKDGVWSSWSSWGSCSESCGGGIRSQTRTCTYKKTSVPGNSCQGTPIQVDICNKQTCPDHKVVFTAYGVTGTTSIVFPQVIQNYGNGYDSSTGKFTCNVPGIYHFSVQISKEYDRKTDLVECFIYRNFSPEVGARVDPIGVRGKPDNDGYSLSMSGTFHLNKDDYVYIGGCTGVSAVYTDNRSSFTGFLVTPDDR